MPDDSGGIDQRYPWRGAEPTDLDLACAQIARRLIAGGRRTIGFLAAPGSGDLLPLLVRVAAALYPFQERQAAVIPDWPEWDDPPPGTPRLGAADHGPSVRPLPGAGGPTLLVPPPVPDADTAVLSLQLALRRMEQRYAQALIDLTGLAGAGAAELAPAARLVDVITVVGTRGRTKVAELRRMAYRIPDGKSLGVVLIG
ncbi:MAG TPA: hypothetical protein VMU50_15960 [Polyangia bacterium]|nr:hypothetical protein [Polyangia bacterium]